MITPYAQQVKELAALERVDLLDAVRHAGIPTSTFYRSVNSDDHELSRETAEKLARAIVELSAR